MDDEESNQAPYISRKERRQKKKMEQQHILDMYNVENNSRNIYPIDLWYLIALYIHPESVKSFTQICKGAYHTTHSKKFWLNLYERYVVEYSTLPSHLKPCEIDVKSGMKARVVRALYHIYPPFSKSVQHTLPISECTHVLENKQCALHWWKQATSCKTNSKIWLFYFKFTSCEYSINSKNIFKMNDLLNYNTESKCVLLRIAATSFLRIRNISGLVLTNLSISVSGDMRHHKVKLCFHEKRGNNIYPKYSDNVIIVDPVLDLQVLNWWDPYYPHPLDH